MTLCVGGRLAGTLPRSSDLDSACHLRDRCQGIPVKSQDRKCWHWEETVHDLPSAHTRASLASDNFSLPGESFQDFS